MGSKALCTNIIKAVLIIVIFAIYLIGCASSNQIAYSQIEKEFQAMHSKMSAGEYETESEQQQAYAKLFQSIANGSALETDKLADLVRKITNNSVDFENSEVFSLAADYAQLFSDLANGNVELGLQDLSINQISRAKAEVEINYLGEVRYGVKMVAAGENWYTGGGSAPYGCELGKYLLEICLYDSELSNCFADRYPNALIQSLGAPFADSEGECLLKGVYTADHGYIIYIGSDYPFNVKSQDSITLYKPIGSITVELLLQ